MPVDMGKGVSLKLEAREHLGMSVQSNNKMQEDRIDISNEQEV